VSACWQNALFDLSDCFCAWCFWCLLSSPRCRQQKRLAKQAEKEAKAAENNDKLAAEGKADQVKADAKKAGENVKDAFK